MTAPVTVIDGAYIATVDVADTEYPSGHIVLVGNRIAAVGAGPPPEQFRDEPRRDGRGCVITPGLVNTHHHLYQWLTRGIAHDNTLFDWLKTLYPVWARIDAPAVHAAAAANLGWLALNGCTTSTDHHYVFPHDAGDCLEAEITAAREIGVRFHPTRGSMDLGQSKGGLPPDSVVEDRDAILAATEVAIDRWHDPSFDAMTRIAVAPCSPFSVTGGLMRESATWLGAPACACTPIWPRLSTRSSSALRHTAKLRLSTSRTWVGWARTCGWPIASTSLMSRSSASPRRVLGSRTVRPRTVGWALGARGFARCSTPTYR